MSIAATRKRHKTDNVGSTEQVATATGASLQPKVPRVVTMQSLRVSISSPDVDVEQRSAAYTAWLLEYIDQHPQLKRLDLTDQLHVSDDGLAVLLNTCRNRGIILVKPCVPLSVLRGQVLSSPMLERIATFLSPVSLVAATRTNRAFRRALTSQTAWSGSKWRVTVNDFFKYWGTFTVSSMVTLEHIVFEQDYLAKMPSLPPLPNLLSITNLYGVETGSSLTQFQRLKHLSILWLPLSDDVLASLAALPLESLELRDRRFNITSLREALGKFRCRHILHIDFSHSIGGLSAEERCELLTVLVPQLFSTRLSMTVSDVSEIVTQRSKVLVKQPPGSLLQKLKLDIRSYEWMEDKTFVAQAIQCLADMYPSLTQLDIAECNNHLSSDELSTLTEYCNGRSITLLQ